MQHIKATLLLLWIYLLSLDEKKKGKTIVDYLVKVLDLSFHNINLFGNVSHNRYQWGATNYEGFDELLSWTSTLQGFDEVMYDLISCVML